jgi:hypothetical protein
MPLTLPLGFMIGSCAGFITSLVIMLFNFRCERCERSLLFQKGKVKKTHGIADWIRFVLAAVAVTILSKWMWRNRPFHNE